MNAIETIAAVVTQATPAVEATPAKGKGKRADKPTQQADKPTGGKGKGVNGRTVKAGGPVVPFYIKDGYRPAAGRTLFAFTHAWLSLSGMASGKAYPTAQARKVAGSTAVAYHLNAGRFEQTAGMLKLTPSGQAFFKERANGNDPETVEAYVKAMQTGKPDGKVIKAADVFGKIEA